MGESGGTTMAVYSPVSRASGVTWSSVTADLLVTMAPSMIWPPTRIVGERFLAVTNWARPTVPPAPGMFTTWMLEASF